MRPVGNIGARPESLLLHLLAYSFPDNDDSNAVVGSRHRTEKRRLPPAERYSISKLFNRPSSPYSLYSFYRSMLDRSEYCSNTLTLLNMKHEASF